ncbi:MAG: hypothetical protein LBF15_05500 [Candidatus Peribacteria bacterium]|nr:hypothetical protein [Candidatus Peribacteria bacterium]
MINDSFSNFLLVSQSKSANDIFISLSFSISKVKIDLLTFNSSKLESFKLLILHISSLDNINLIIEVNLCCQSITRLLPSSLVNKNN